MLYLTYNIGNCKYCNSWFKFKLRCLFMGFQNVYDPSYLFRDDIT